MCKETVQRRTALRPQNETNWERDGELEFVHLSMSLIAMDNGSGLALVC